MDWVEVVLWTIFLVVKIVFPCVLVFGLHICYRGVSKLILLASDPLYREIVMTPVVSSAREAHAVATITNRLKEAKADGRASLIVTWKELDIAEDLTDLQTKIANMFAGFEVTPHIVNYKQMGWHFAVPFWEI